MLNFTRQERAVIYFLVITLGIGAALRLVKDRRLAEEIKPDRFYEEQDEFLEIAETINSGRSGTSFETVPVNEESIRNGYPENVDTGSETGKININNAGVSELSKLPGIGPVLAQRIRTYVDDNGPFQAKEEIMLVKGIGEKLYSRIQDLVTTE